jgi:putative transposase
VARDGSNERWCSDSFLVPCANGEVVEVGFALDCCDRECIAALGRPRDLCSADIGALMHAAVAARFPAGRAESAVQWLSDNEGMYTALETVETAERLGSRP